MSQVERFPHGLGVDLGTCHPRKTTAAPRLFYVCTTVELNATALLRAGWRVVVTKGTRLSLRSSRDRLKAPASCGLPTDNRDKKRLLPCWSGNQFDTSRITGLDLTYPEFCQMRPLRPKGGLRSASFSVNETPQKVAKSRHGCQRCRA
jgi:hypothetical protein